MERRTPTGSNGASSGGSAASCLAPRCTLPYLRPTLSYRSALPCHSCSAAAERARGADRSFDFGSTHSSGVGPGLFLPGFQRVRSAVVPGFRFRKGATQDAAEAYGVKAVHVTARKPDADS